MAQIDKRKAKVLEALINPEYKTITAVSEATDVPRRTIYNWFEDEDFIEALDKIIKKHSNTKIALVWNALINKCLTGDVNAIKLFFEMMDKYKQKVDVNSYITFVDDVDE